MSETKKCKDCKKYIGEDRLRAGLCDICFIVKYKKQIKNLLKES